MLSCDCTRRSSLFFFSSRRRHTRWPRDWSSDVCSSDLGEDDSGVFSQLATLDGLQGLGIATMLIAAAEQRVRGRGLAFATLGVEDGNPRARRLYQRLGYQASGRQHASWE